MYLTISSPKHTIRFGLRKFRWKFRGFCNYFFALYFSVCFLNCISISSIKFIYYFIKKKKKNQLPLTKKSLINYILWSYFLCDLNPSSNCIRPIILEIHFCLGIIGWQYQFFFFFSIFTDEDKGIKPVIFDQCMGSKHHWAKGNWHHGWIKQDLNLWCSLHKLEFTILIWVYFFFSQFYISKQNQFYDLV